MQRIDICDIICYNKINKSRKAVCFKYKSKHIATKLNEKQFLSRLKTFCREKTLFDKGYNNEDIFVTKRKNNRLWICRHSAVVGRSGGYANIGHTQRGCETCQYDRSLCTKLGSFAVDALFEGVSGEMVTIYNAAPQTVSLEKVLGSGATGETSKGGSHNVDSNGFVVKTARNIGISFGD